MVEYYDPDELHSRFPTRDEVQQKILEKINELSEKGIIIMKHNHDDEYYPRSDIDNIIENVLQDTLPIIKYYPNITVSSDQNVCNITHTPFRQNYGLSINGSFILSASDLPNFIDITIYINSDNVKTVHHALTQDDLQKPYNFFYYSADSNLSSRLCTISIHLKSDSQLTITDYVIKTQLL